MAKLHWAHKTLHTTTFLGLSAKFTTQNSGVSAKFHASKFTTAKLTRQPPPPHTLYCVYVFGLVCVCVCVCVCLSVCPRPKGRSRLLMNSP